MSLYGLFKGTGENGFGWSTTADEVTDGLDLSGRTILITGSNSGLGFETMRVLAARGATVLAAARSQQKADDAASRVDGDTHPVVCELSDPSSVRACADDIRAAGHTLDAIICNAGIMALPKRQTVFGYEKQFFVNHVGHFILVTELLDELADDGRVVVLSSAAHEMAPDKGIEFDDLGAEKRYGDWRAYGHSKLANLLFARELGRRFDSDDTDRVANAVHPGPIDTNLTRNMNALFRGLWSVAGPLFLKSIPEGSATQAWAAAHPDAADINGEYMADCNVAESSGNGADMQMAKRLWERTESIVDEVTDAGDQPNGSDRAAS